MKRNKNVHLADVYSSIKRTLPNVEWTSTGHVAHKPNMYSMYTGHDARPTATGHVTDAMESI